MRILKIKQNSDDWRGFREERISGTKVGKLFNKSRKVGEIFDTEKPAMMFYEILAERLTVGAHDAISPQEQMQRGHELEGEAITLAVEKLGLKKVATDNVWIDENNDNFICSPDAYEDSKKPTWAIEVKCLSSARHVEALVTNVYPSDYKSQVLNYFLINESLKTLYFVMYDPRFVDEHLQMRIFTVKRNEVEYELERLRDVREEAEVMINNLIKKLRSQNES